jgi:hypothetical protein
VCGGTGSVGSLTHMSQDCSQFFTLSLSTDVCTQATLQELKSTLILGHLQQLHGTSFVGSMADNFTHQLADEFCVLGLDLKREDEKNFIKKVNRKISLDDNGEFENCNQRQPLTMRKSNNGDQS